MYSVWVGGSEVNDTYLDHKSALRIADVWIERGYDDVIVEQIPLTNTPTI